MRLRVPPQPPAPALPLPSPRLLLWLLPLQSRMSEVFGVDIHPAARIGWGVMMDHATGAHCLAGHGLCWCSMLGAGMELSQRAWPSS